MNKTPVLDVASLDAFHGDLQALFGVSLQLARGEIAAIIGANGAGKTTLLEAIAGLVMNKTGCIRHADVDVTTRPAHELLARGIALVPEGRRLFPSLSLEENLLIGGQIRRPGPWSLARVYELFPILYERRSQSSTSLSGGQQQMVAIGRALMSNPNLLLCDEISLGLAPIVGREIYSQLPFIAADGLSMLIVEQDIAQALKASSRVYCMREGRVAMSGRSANLTREEITSAYFGSVA